MYLENPNAKDLLFQLAGRSPWARHCLAVAQIARELAVQISWQTSVDVNFVNRAALLHDIGRCKTHDPILHGVEGYLLLRRYKLEAEAFVCASHVLFGLEVETAARFGLPARNFIPKTLEQKLVPLADFLVQHDRATSFKARFAALRKKNRANTFFLERLTRAELKTKTFATDIFQRYGIDVEQTALKILPPSD